MSFVLITAEAYCSMYNAYQQTTHQMGHAFPFKTATGFHLTIYAWENTGVSFEGLLWITVIFMGGGGDYFMGVEYTVFP